MRSARSIKHTSERGADLESELELLVRASHLQAIFKYSLVILLANLSASATLVAGLWSAVPRNQLVGWLATVVIFNIARWFKARQFAANSLRPSETKVQEALLLGATLISGLLWGIAAILFYVPDQPALSLFLALILVAITAASTVLLSFHWLAYPIFCVPVVIPLAVQLGTDHGTSHLAVALVIPLYYSLLFILSRQIYQFSHEAILNSLIRERHALTDDLTAIPNRRAFEGSLQREWLRAMSNERPLTLIMANINAFKTYNEHHGRSVGDAVLRSVAHVLRQATGGRNDFAARIGGDEFAVILPDTDGRRADGVVQAIRENVALLADTTFKRWSFPSLSFGVVTVTPNDSDSAFALFEQAEAALRAARKAKRFAEAPSSAK